MTVTLESYVQGAWVKGQGKAADLFNATTEAKLAEVLHGRHRLRRATAAYARETGGPALRAMTFGAASRDAEGPLRRDPRAPRGADPSSPSPTPAPPAADAKFDIDGATGTLAAYAYFGKELGDRHFLADGDGVQLGRTPRFWGQHVLVPRDTASPCTSTPSTSPPGT